MKDYFAEDRLVLFSCFGDVMDSASEVLWQCFKCLQYWVEDLVGQCHIRLG
jgi:hypothetical protein